MIMKQKVLALSVAAALTGGVGVANAALTVQEAGVGHALVTPYFSANNNQVSIISVVNTDTVNAKAVKVRFRSAVDSDDIMDFQVFLSPADVWNGTVFSQAGRAYISSTDNSCSIPTELYTPTAGSGNPFSTNRLVSYTDDAGTIHSTTEQTLEGYVEIFNMADIPPAIASGVGTALNATTASANPLFTAIKHVAGTPPCRTSTASQAVLNNIEANATTSGAVITVPVAATGTATVGAANYVAGQQLAMPTTGLMGNWVILNTTTSLTYGGEMSAIQAGAGDQTMIVYSGQTADPRTATNAGAVDTAGANLNTFPELRLTADRVLQLGSTVGVAAAKYDFPDMSTPYLARDAVTGVGVITALTPDAQANSLSGAITRARIMNEFSTGSAYGGGTDWVASMPTRRYHVAGRGTTYLHQTAGTAVSLTTLNGATGNVTAPFAGQVGVNNCAGTTATNIVTFASNGRSSKVTTAAAPVLYDRSETTSTCVTSTPVFSPATPGVASIYQLPGEVNVLSWNNSGTKSSTIGATVVLTNITATINNTTANEGWGVISLRDGVTVGLPMIGSAFMKAANGSLPYGTNLRHRY